jgi:DNA-binding phage protein
MGKTDTNVSGLCKELGITRQPLYRHVSPTGALSEAGQKVLTQRR